mgnify:CR=1 FL=1
MEKTLEKRQVLSDETFLWVKLFGALIVCKEDCPHSVAGFCVNQTRYFKDKYHVFGYVWMSCEYKIKEMIKRGWK